MNRTRKQIRAAKARKAWKNLQEQILEAEKNKMPNLKKVKNTKKEDSLTHPIKKASQFGKPFIGPNLIIGFGLQHNMTNIVKVFLLPAY